MKRFTVLIILLSLFTWTFANENPVLAQEPSATIKSNDVVWTPPGVKYWHGPAATNSIQKTTEDQNLEWMEQVSDEEYGPILVDTTQVTTTTTTLPGLTPEDVGMVSPALEQYMQEALLGDLWERPELSPRDRSIVTLAALIARNQTGEMPYYFELALDNGVTPGELSEMITHLAFYSGWTNAMSAVAVAQDIFAERGIGVDQLPAASPELLPLDQEAEERRAAIVEQTVSPISPGLVQYTGELLFQDLWLRPDLGPRDRSLVTVSALIAAGQVEQIGFHLNRAMDNGLTQTEAGEVLTHLAFYAGWPNAFSSVSVAGDVFENRPD
jgi:4-carboxymuconolactone decarboxylase